MTLVEGVCPICRSDLRPWRRKRFIVCSSCGYVGVRPDLKTKQVSDVQLAYFGDEFVERQNALLRGYEAIVVRGRLRELSAILPEGRVLEVGVGRGCLLALLQAAGYRAEGLDLSPEVCGRMAERGLRVHCGTLESHQSTNTYDAIVMCHVLEHIEDAMAALTTARSFLGAEGILYIAAPNVASWNAWLAGWSGFAPYHVHYFRRSSLVQALERTGFMVVSARTAEPISGWFNAVVRTLFARTEMTRTRAEARSPRRRLPLALYDAVRLIVGGLLTPGRWIQARLGYGEELVVIARAVGAR